MLSSRSYLPGVLVTEKSGGMNSVGVGVGAGNTVTTVRAVADTPLQRAVSVSTVVTPGDTTTEPGVPTPPMPWSISTASAFVTAPQLKVAEPPAGIVEGEALKDEIMGVPAHPSGGAVPVGGIGVNVRVGDTTVIASVRRTG
jgi:hypothetical protein